MTEFSLRYLSEWDYAQLIIPLDDGTNETAARAILQALREGWRAFHHKLQDKTDRYGEYRLTPVFAKAGGEVDLGSEQIQRIWQQLVQHEGLRDELVEHIQEVREYLLEYPQDECFVWEEDFYQINFQVTLALAAADRQYITLFASYLTAWNSDKLTHEMCAGIDALLKQYGWCDETESIYSSLVGAVYFQYIDSWFENLASTHLAAYANDVQGFIESRFFEKCWQTTLGLFLRVKHNSWIHTDEHGCVCLGGHDANLYGSALRSAMFGFFEDDEAAGEQAYRAAEQNLLASLRAERLLPDCDCADGIRFDW